MKSLGLIVLGLVLGALPAGYFYQEASEARSAQVALEEKVRLLEDERSRLQTRVDALEEEKRSLEEKLQYYTGLAENLSRRVEALEEEKKRLEANLSQARGTIEELRAQLARVEEEKAGLEARVEELESRLEEFTSMLDYTLAWYFLGDYEDVFDEVLAAAPQTVAWEAWTLLSGLDSTGERVLAVFRYIEINTTYYYDGYTRLFDGDDVLVWGHYIMLPNETLLLGGGDCDDLAILAYAMLRAVPLEGERVYLISWYPREGPGHMAVLVVAPEGYYILDPAGDYLNGFQIYLEMMVTDYDGNDWYYYLQPMNLANTTKQRLLYYNMARLYYYDYLTGQDYYHLDSVPAYTSAYHLLYDWIKDYWGVDRLDSIVIDAPGLHLEFHSIGEAASWIEGEA